MQGFVKTLIGDKRTVAVVAIAVLIAYGLLHTPIAIAAGFVMPICLVAGAVYLAQH